MLQYYRLWTLSAQLLSKKLLFFFPAWYLIKFRISVCDAQTPKINKNRGRKMLSNGRELKNFWGSRERRKIMLSESRAGV